MENFTTDELIVMANELTLNLDAANMVVLELIEIELDTRTELEIMESY